MPDSTDLAKAVADRYRIEREIGQGGMASVYLAHDIRHDRNVAIKVLHPELAAALGGERFLAEIKTTARLQHPHILPLLDSGDANGVLYYVMPFVAGETLRARLDREHLLPIDDALRIGREVADALDHAHRFGVIHRDIKPENILLQDGHALVADFGIALAVQQAGGARMTQTGLSLGTPQYMSPEQAMGERAIDARSDLYALGAVMYEMLAGDPPFTGSTVQAIVAKVITEKPARIVTLRDRVPLHVEAAVLRALEKLPADRWGTVREFIVALGNTSLAFAAADGVKSSVAPRLTERRRRIPAIVVGVCLLAAGGAAGWMVSPSLSREPSRAAVTITSILPPAGTNFGEQQSVALSPDGRRLAFVVSAPDGSRMLWTRDIEKLDAKPLARTSGGNIPFWSPDGRSIGFFANGHLQVVDSSGDVRRLCPVSDPNAGSWSKAGVILFSDREGILSVPAAGGTCRMIVPRVIGPVLRAVFLPDGKRMLYSRGRFADLTIADGDGTTVGSLPIQAQIYAFVAPNFLVYPNAGDAHALDVQRVDMSSLKLIGPAVRLANGIRTRAGIHTFSVSASGDMVYLPGGQDPPYLLHDGRNLFDTIRVEGTWTVAVRPARAGPPTVAVAGNVAGMWLYDITSGRATRVLVSDTSVSRVREGIGATWPVFSPDGSRLAYAAASKDRCGINEHDLQRATDRVIVRTRLVNMYGCPVPLDWSADGQTLLVRSDTSLKVVTLDGKDILEVARPGQVWEGHFSPDGRAVAYSSDETTRSEVYVQSVAGGVPARISLEGGRWPLWLSGGRRLVFMTPTGKVQEVPMNGLLPSGAPRTLFTVPNWRRSTFDDRGVGFAVIGDGERYVVRQSAAGYAFAYVQNWPSLLDR